MNGYLTMTLRSCAGRAYGDASTNPVGSSH